MHIFKRIHNGDISLEDIEKEQIKFKRELTQSKDIQKIDQKNKRRQ